MTSENITSGTTPLNINFTANIKCLMDRYKLSAVELARQISVSPELIIKLKRGSLSNPTLRVLTKLAQHFNISIADLVFENFSNNRSINKYFINSTSYIPVFDWEQMRNLDSVPAEDSIKEYTVVLKKFHKEVFALKLNSDYGVFATGEVVFVDPQLTMQNNSYALVQSRANSVISIRKIIAEDEYHLQSIIPEINTTVKYNEKEHKIVGILVGHQKLDFFKI